MKEALRNWMKELALEGKFNDIPEELRQAAKAWADRVKKPEPKKEKPVK